MVRDIMQKGLMTLSPENSIRDAAKKMRDTKTGCIVISNAHGVEGFITERDLSCWLADGKDPDMVKVKYIMHRDVISTSPLTDVFEASRIMAMNHIRGLPVIEDGTLCGMITASDIAPILEEEIDNFLEIEGTHHH